MLHLDAQGAKRSYISAIREKEKEEKERASECEAAMLVHQSFIKARASCERAASLVRAGRRWALGCRVLVGSRSA